MANNGDDILYKEMTNEEYLSAIVDTLKDVGDNRILRYLYIFISEKLKRVL